MTAMLSGLYTYLFSAQFFCSFYTKNETRAIHGRKLVNEVKKVWTV